MSSISASMIPEAVDFAEIVRLKRVDGLRDTFDTVNKPATNGYSKNIVVYGGISLALTIQAAFHTLDPAAGPRAIHSVLGHFLALATTHRTLRVSVERIRDTRTFATRHVRISQAQDDGTRRLCLFAAVDFVASSKDATDGPGTLLRYNPRDHRSSTSVEDQPDLPSWMQHRFDQGKISHAAFRAYPETFSLHLRHFEYRMDGSSPLGQAAMGVAPESLETPPKDGVALTDMVSSVWGRVRRPLSIEYDLEDGELRPTVPSLGASLAGFWLDSSLAVIPLVHGGVSWTQASAVASLDFALRFHADHFDLEDWIVHELRTVAGGWQRTFNEARLVARDGTLIATITQQCVLRPALPSRL